jgi:hypothetical protein
LQRKTNQIEKDDFSRNVQTARKMQDYEAALNSINRNSTSRSLNRRLIEEQKEIELEEHLRKTQDEREKRKLLEENEKQAAIQHFNEMRLKYHENKMRQQVRENNQELRELESRLRTAYVSKALAAQKSEREVLKLAEKMQEQQENVELEKLRQEHIEQEKIKQEKMRERRRQLGKDLKEQIISNHQRHQILYEQFLRDKIYFDEIARRLKEEMLEEMKKKVDAKERTKKDMEEMRIAKQELARLQQIENDEENERIKVYCQHRDKKIQEEEERCRELQQQRESLNEKMVKELTELIVSLFVCLSISFYYISLILSVNVI